MTEKLYKTLMVAIMLAIGGGTSFLVTRAQQAPAALSSSTTEKVVNYIRQRFGVGGEVQLALGPLERTFVPDFWQTIVSVDDGKKKGAQPVLISKDSRYLIVVLGGFIDLKEGTEAEMVQRVRDVFKVPPAVKITIGGFHRSPSPDFLEGTMTSDDGKGKQPRTVLLSVDHRHLIVSDMFDLGVDLQKQALHILTTHNAPFQGPANAPVTIVEFADLECPMCAKMHDFIENQLLPRYPGKVRIVFKEFPLVAVHDWSLIAAIGDQCAYELNPSSYVPLRTAIFRSQPAINITNVREMVLNYGEQSGVDRVKLAACLDSKATLPRVHADMEEGKRVNVDRTPTAFVNGKMIISLPSPETYYQAVDEALKEAAAGGSARAEGHKSAARKRM